MKTIDLNDGKMFAIMDGDTEEDDVVSCRKKIFGVVVVPLSLTAIRWLSAAASRRKGRSALGSCC